MKLLHTFAKITAVIALSLAVFIPFHSAEASSTATPARIIIPTIKVSSPVKAMGLTKDNKMDVPNNYTEVGWYSYGNVPGMKGSAVMGAHVDNGGKKPTSKGVFKNLAKLKKGDDIYVTDKDGNKLHFKVTATKVYAYNEPSTGEVFSSGNTAKEAQLNLITCHGTWMPKLGTYDKRLVVFSKLV